MSSLDDKRLDVEGDCTAVCHICGNKAVYQNKQGNWLCSTSSSKCPCVRKKNSEALKKARLENRVTRKFSKEDRRKALESFNKRLSSIPFEHQSWQRKRNLVILEQKNKCLICNLSEWMGKPIKLHVDHVDGNNKNDARDNLRALCPNCHSNTETYCGKNINSGSKKVSDEAIIEEIRKGLTNRQILLNTGLTPKGGNYERVNKIRLKIQSNE